MYYYHYYHYSSPQLGDDVYEMYNHVSTVSTAILRGCIGGISPIVHNG
jgi:hypothetical protein